jgi:hypothetical protein
MIPAMPVAGAGRAPAPIAGPSPLSAGFYQLTLLAAFLSTIELRLRPLDALPSTAIAELVVFPAFLCAVAELLLRPGLGGRVRALYAQNRALAWYGGYAALAAVAGLTRSSDSIQAFHDLACALALYVLVSLTVDNQARLAGLLLANLGGALLGLALALLQIRMGGPYLLPRSEIVDEKLDLAGDVVQNVPTGLFAHPNGFILWVPVLLFLVVAIRRALARREDSALPLIAIVAAMGFVLKMAYVKGVYAWLAAALCTLLLPRRFDRARLPLALLMPVAGITALTWFSVHAFLDGEVAFGTVACRIILWLTSLDIIQGDPFIALFGSGTPEIQRRLLMTFEYPNAHNTWINQALTYGVPALLLYLAAVATALRDLAARARSGGPAARDVALAAMASLIALLGDYFFEPLDRGVMPQAQLFMLLAVAALSLPEPGAAAQPAQEAT